ncbi:MAG: hypothetical protein NT068_04210 [Candidatus Nomurabacteria bacterium]|nr:hypothetical protein [Candidatus Nomurabacteria bacterium]
MKKQDIRIISQQENVEEIHPYFGNVKWELIITLQVFNNDGFNGNPFTFKYSLLKDIPKEQYKKFRKGVRDNEIFFEIEVPKPEHIKNESEKETKKRRFFPYPIRDDWDVYNYYRQDIQQLNGDFILRVGEEEWYGLFMHYMPDICMRAFRKLGKPTLLS